MVRRDAARLGLTLPGRCLELLTKEQDGRKKIATRKRTEEYRRTDATRRGENKLQHDLDIIESTKLGDTYHKTKLLFDNAKAGDVYDREIVVRNAANRLELDQRRTKHAKSTANETGDWGIVCHYCIQVLSDRTKASNTMLSHSALKAKLQTHRKGKNCSNIQKTFTVPAIKDGQKFFVFTKDSPPILCTVDRVDTNLIYFHFVLLDEQRTSSMQLDEFTRDLIDYDIILRSR